jgi:hypothetical protein
VTKSIRLVARRAMTDLCYVLVSKISGEEHFGTSRCRYVEMTLIWKLQKVICEDVNWIQLFQERIK